MAPNTVTVSRLDMPSRRIVVDHDSIDSLASFVGRTAGDAEIFPTVAGSTSGSAGRTREAYLAGASFPILT